MTEAMGMLDKYDEPLEIAGRRFRSRLILGTGKYSDNDTMVEAITASGTEIVTVAVRRVDLDRTSPPDWPTYPNAWTSASVYKRQPGGMCSRTSGIARSTIT